MIFDISKIRVLPSGRVDLDDAALASLEASFVPTGGGSTNTGKCVNDSCGTASNESDCRNLTTCSTDNQQICEGGESQGPIG